MPTNLSHGFTVVEGTEEEREYIDKKIDAYNGAQVPFTQDQLSIPIDYIIKENNQIIGGISAFLYGWKILYINILWVDEKFRKKGLGWLLLKKVEEKAISSGCTLIHLDTFDFQAKDFYLKYGYTVFGVLDNCPPGHQRFYLKKGL